MGASLLSRLGKGLRQTRERLSQALGRGEDDHFDIHEFRDGLVMADLGLPLAEAVARRVQGRSRSESASMAAKEALAGILVGASSESPPLEFSVKPLVVMVCGVNGVGKTTTIGKWAQALAKQGKKTLIAAADTYRAAAVEQLSIWGERAGVEVFSLPGSQPSAVVFDACQRAKAKNFDVLLVDTAGRMHTKAGLMEELKKIKRVLGRHDESAPHETVMVLDASTGRNALNQAKAFHEALGLDSLVLTKCDGSAKGGAIFAIVNELRLPIRFLGIGESADDLVDFRAADFIDSLLPAEAES